MEHRELFGTLEAGIGAWLLLNSADTVALGAFVLSLLLSILFFWNLDLVVIFFITILPVIRGLSEDVFIPRENLVVGFVERGRGDELLVLSQDLTSYC